MLTTEEYQGVLTHSSLLAKAAYELVTTKSLFDLPEKLKNLDFYLGSYNSYIIGLGKNVDS